MSRQEVAASFTVARGDLKQLEDLLTAGCSLDGAWNGPPLLQTAVEFDQIAAAQLLLQRGADLNSQPYIIEYPDEYPLRPDQDDKRLPYRLGGAFLLLAAARGCQPMVQLLAAAGPDVAAAAVLAASAAACLPHIKAKQASDTAESAAEEAAAAAAAAHAARGPAAEADAQDQDPTAAATAAAAEAATDLAPLELRHTREAQRVLALVKAVAGKHAAAALSLLLATLGDINQAGPSGKTALQLAAGAGAHGAVRLLLAKGAAVNVSAGGYTAVGWAAVMGHSAVVQQLLAAGAVPTAADVLLAAMCCREAVVQQLVAAGGEATAALRGHADPSLPLCEALLQGHSDAAMQQLLSAETDVRWELKGGWTAMHLAAAAGRPGVVRALIAAGADVSNVSKVDVDGFRIACLTPLHMLAGAAAVDDTEAASAWKGQDAAADDQDQVWEGRKQVAQMLLAHGADVNAREFGYTPLFVAADTGSEQAVQLLLELGANVNTGALIGASGVQTPFIHCSMEAEPPGCSGAAGRGRKHTPMFPRV